MPLLMETMRERKVLRWLIFGIACLLIGAVFRMQWQGTSYPPLISPDANEHQSSVQSIEATKTLGETTLDGNAISAQKHSSSPNAISTENTGQTMGSLSVLSPDWVHEFTDICDTPLTTCGRYRPLAMKIAESVGTEGDDHWPIRMEKEIDEYLTRVADANAMVKHSVLCATLGCLIYISGNPSTLFGSTRANLPLGKFLKATGNEAWTQEMAWVLRPKGYGPPTDPCYWWDGIFTKPYAVLFVCERLHR